MEIEINGHEYRTTKLNVFDQLKVTRKLLPVLSGLTDELQKLQQGEMPIATVLPVIANSIAQMSDEDCNAILHSCLAVVSRKNAKAWTLIFRQGELMFDDIDLKALLEIVARVIGDSLGNFFSRTPRQRDSQPPVVGLTLNSLPDGKDFLRLLVKYGYIKFDKLKDGSIDLADLAEMNEWIDIEQDNEARIARWRNHHD